LQEPAGPGLLAHGLDLARDQALAGRLDPADSVARGPAQAEHRQLAKRLARSVQHQEGAADGRSIPRQKKAR
jgi:hypothetical protein